MHPTLHSHTPAKSKHRPPPEAVDTHTLRAGLRTVAVFEAVKGIAILAAGFGILSLLGKDSMQVAEHWVHKLHLNPAGHLSRVFLNTAENVTDAHLMAAAAGALAYSIVRFVEAYGLWNARVWAEWFALLSGSLYLPWEIYEVVSSPTPWKWGILATNLCIILYMLYVRIQASRPVPD
jgi:uncharacterized membrane protein (DUF2068 family)